MLATQSDMRWSRIDLLAPFIWIVALFMLQSCTDAVSVDDARSHAASDRNTPIELESSLAVSEDGRVSASGPVENVSAARIALAGADFNVTNQTTMSDRAGGPMSIGDVRLGMFLEAAGRVLNDGSYELSSARADSTVIICHIPPGDPDSARTLQVGFRSLPAHLNHGDYEGACEELTGTEGGDQDEFVDNDEDEDELEDEGDDSGVPKAVMCHVPPGNPDNAHTISIDSLDVQEHLDHGDYFGDCASVVEPQDGEGGEGVETGGSEDPSDEGESDEPDEERVSICHVPSGNPDHARTVWVDASDVQDHLDHGDSLGECPD